MKEQKETKQHLPIGMTSHAKHAGARPVASGEELARLSQGTRRAVLGGDSFGRFDDCALCLRRAADPVCCPRGHVFCRECVCRSLLHQRRTIAARQAACRRLCAARASADAADRRAAQQDLVAALRRIDAGIAAAALQVSPSKKARTGTDDSDDYNDFVSAPTRPRTTTRTTTPVSATGACFWLPSQTPAARTTVADVAGVASEAEVAALRPMCPAAPDTGPDAHALRLRQLIPLVFTDAPPSAQSATSAASATAAAEEEQGEPDDGAPQQQQQQQERQHQCPVCLRALTNNRRCALPRPCGHVACLECIRTLLTPAATPDKDSKKKPQRTGKCFVCGCEFAEADIVPLCAGATGYAGHGDQLVVETYRPSLPLP